MDAVIGVKISPQFLLGAFSFPMQNNLHIVALRCDFVSFA